MAFTSSRADGLRLRAQRANTRSRANTSSHKGLGALQLAYEQLKKRLQAEGLFDDARKRPLPALPRKIGIVTSLDGAAIRDMLKVLGRRYRNAQIVIRSTRVQGEGSALDIAQAIHAIAACPDVDVLIVGRGGGSIEDLWAFNEESVARAIADCPWPVISAVGHESDVTIADFVADRRAPTPSAAAEIVVAAQDEFCHRIDRIRDRLDAAALGRIQALSRRVHVLSGRTALAGFPMRLALRGRDVTELDAQASATDAVRLSASRTRCSSQLRRQLEIVRPRTTARRHPDPPRDVRRSAADGNRPPSGPGARPCCANASVGSIRSVLWPCSAADTPWRGMRTARVRCASASEVNAGDRIRVTLAAGELECDVRKTG